MRSGKRKWLTPENALLALAVRQVYTRRRSVQITPVGFITSRPEEELNRGITPRDDAQHPYPGRLYWEWWYFDAKLDDGHRCVLELQTPNLLNILADECAMLFHVYTPDGKEYNNIVPFPRSMWSASTETCDVAIGDNTIRGFCPEYRVKFTHDNLACDLRFENLIPGWTRGTGEVMFGHEASNHLFGWVVAQPRAAVTGTLTVDGVEHKVEGLGYHDHNWGSGYLPLYISSWVWGRLSTDRFTMIFADITTSRRCGGVHVPLVFLAMDDRIIFESFSADARASDYKMDSRGYQVYPSKVEFQFADSDVAGELRLEVKKELENTAFLEGRVPSLALDAIGRLLVAPAYYRFLSEFSGNIQVKGEKFEIEGETHWEYMALRLRRGQEPRPAGKIPF